MTNVRFVNDHLQSCLLRRSRPLNAGCSCRRRVFGYLFLGQDLHSFVGSKNARGKDNQHAHHGNMRLRQEILDFVVGRFQVTREECLILRATLLMVQKGRMNSQQCFRHAYPTRCKLSLHKHNQLSLLPQRLTS